jgi:hypothetical protein
MEQTLGYIIFGTGWPVLIIGSIWMWRKVAQLTGPAKTFLNITLVTFYVLGYTCTVYWLGQPWLMGVLPAFIVFLVLFIATIRGAITWSKSV